MSGKNYFRQRISSFKYAGNGIVAFLRSGPHARIHGVISVAVVVAGIYCRLSAGEWAVIVLAIALVWITEMINTVIEKIMDHVTPEYHPQVKWIKDVAAAAVLVAAIAAVILGALVFWPYCCR